MGFNTWGGSGGQELALKPDHHCSQEAASPVKTLKNQIKKRINLDMKEQLHFKNLFKLSTDC